VIDRLAHDLRTAFPDSNGYSPRNLEYMRAPAEVWPDLSAVDSQVRGEQDGSTIGILLCL
jgi:hypothetical protein